MGLRWLIHSAGHLVLGYPKDTDVHQNHAEENSNGDGKKLKEMCPTGFQMPLHYPRYTKAEYEKMEGWKVDILLGQYGLSSKGSVDEKRAYAMGAFLWPDQY